MATQTPINRISPDSEPYFPSRRFSVRLERDLEREQPFKGKLLQRSAILIALVLILFSIVAAPYWTLRRLRGALDAGDEDVLEAVVDFPTLRRNIKAQFDAENAADILDSKADSRFFNRDSPALRAIYAQVDHLASAHAIAVLRKRQLQDDQRLHVPPNGRRIIRASISSSFRFRLRILRSTYN